MADRPAFLGIDEWRFHGPVLIGDTIRVRNSIVKLEDRDEMSGIVDLEWDIFNQNDTVTCNVLIRVLQAKRQGGQ